MKATLIISPETPAEILLHEIVLEYSTYCGNDLLLYSY